ncbi:uncharacterized protein N7506_000016 [Penicillium brevicompactum]|uniref:uncharacterized protein n=1 Tax=Penicillium brevicompactum TaxID=5074 RepID=UPI00253FC821|nr:uncharacterized protein N7506_000016 [Penicillium brevicompactum]KAJ5346763.1 hypothetical protein N7506_000016 [Penicillium brevicompactum]
MLFPKLSLQFASNLQQRDQRFALFALSERLRMYKNSGSLSRHFVSKHVKPFSNDMRCECSICGEKLESKSMLLNHAERVHGTVSRSSKTALGLT